MEMATRIVFGLVSLVLMLLAAALVVYALVDVFAAFGSDKAALGAALLEAVGYTVIAMAVFDVGKYILEEEAIRAREMRDAGEARRSMTKFISTIAIAVFLEALVSVFEASKSDLRLMLYPTLLLFAGVSIVVGLGVYQRLSAKVETEVDDEKEDASDRPHGGKSAKSRSR